MIFAMSKPKVIPFSDFMDRSYREKNRLQGKTKKENIVTYSLLGLSALCVILDPLGGSVAMASGIEEKIIRAFDPIIELLQGISYPVAFVFITAGFLLIMTGQKSRGLQLMKYAGIGYLGMQLAPGLMAILAELGKELSR